MAKLSSSVQSEVSALVDGSSSILVENAALKQQASRLGERVIEAESASLDQVPSPPTSPPCLLPDAGRGPLCGVGVGGVRGGRGCAGGPVRSLGDPFPPLQRAAAHPPPAPPAQISQVTSAADEDVAGVLATNQGLAASRTRTPRPSATTAARRPSSRSWARTSGSGCGLPPPPPPPPHAPLAARMLRATGLRRDGSTAALCM
jgi:hypothetical protein